MLSMMFPVVRRVYICYDSLANAYTTSTEEDALERKYVFCPATIGPMVLTYERPPGNHNDEQDNLVPHWSVPTLTSRGR